MILQEKASFLTNLKGSLIYFKALADIKLFYNITSLSGLK
jgi:hypothetical protein